MLWGPRSHAEGRERGTPMARAEKERSFGLWDAKGGNSGCENATRPHLPQSRPEPGVPVAAEAGTGLRGSSDLPPGEGSPPSAPAREEESPAAEIVGSVREEPAAWAPLPASAARRPRPLAYRPKSPASVGTCSGSPHSPPGSGSAGLRLPTPAPWWA